MCPITDLGSVYIVEIEQKKKSLFKLISESFELYKIYFKMVKVKYNTKNEVLSISESMNGDSVVAQSTFCLNFKKICALLRSCWQSSRENIGMSCIMAFIGYKIALFQSSKPKSRLSPD